ncbi:prepilin peptidase CpaA [Salibacterium salarium]|uniref:A24 family peptidase n=1 Tax=Salibacterium salarium TaxID=284579 RepID=UPI0027878EE7|nr:A24 family peptidase [Salibacterium salarium]MDQ0298880.1 prepilin peptidase CpaA [Salibacterium salarium]
MSIFIAILSLIIAVLYDLKQRRIPNWLTFGLMIVGLSISVIAHGTFVLLEHTLAMLAAFLSFFIIYLCNGIGAGDVKLVTGLSALLGLPFIMVGIPLILIFGGIYSATILIWHRGLRYIGRDIINGFFASLWNKRMHQYMKYVKKNGIFIPYSIVIFIGSGVTLWIIY